MSDTNFDPDYVFSHHHASQKQLEQYAAIHESAKEFARVILANVPACSDRNTVLKLLRESAMLACSAISLEGRLTK